MYIVGAHMDGHGTRANPEQLRCADGSLDSLCLVEHNHMTSTDSTPFMNFTPAISVRENERGMHTGAGWNPHWHKPSDVYATFSDKDFRLGLNAAQTTLGAIAELAGATLKK